MIIWSNHLISNRMVWLFAFPIKIPYFCDSKTVIAIDVPFVYGKIADKDNFIDRREERKYCIRN